MLVKVNSTPDLLPPLLFKRSLSTVTDDIILALRQVVLYSLEMSPLHPQLRLIPNVISQHVDRHQWREEHGDELEEDVLDGHIGSVPLALFAVVSHFKDIFCIHE